MKFITFQYISVPITASIPSTGTSLFSDLSVIENLNGISELSKQPNLMTVDEIIHTFNLKKIINKKGRELSGGQRRKQKLLELLLEIQNFYC